MDWSWDKTFPDEERGGVAETLDLRLLWWRRLSSQHLVQVIGACVVLAGMPLVV